MSIVLTRCRQSLPARLGCGLRTLRIASHVRAVRLKPLPFGYASEQYDLYVYMLRRTFIPKKNRVLADFLYEELKQHPDLQPFELS